MRRSVTAIRGKEVILLDANEETIRSYRMVRADIEDKPPIFRVDYSTGGGITFGTEVFLREAHAKGFAESWLNDGKIDLNYGSRLNHEE